MVKEGYFEYNSSDDNSDSEYKHTDKKFEKILHEATITDFINCPATNQILETEFYFKVENDLHDSIEGTYESFCKEKNDEGSNILSGDTEACKGSSLFSILYKHLEKEYDLDVFYNEPALAYPIVTQKEDAIKKEREEKLEELRSKSKAAKSNYDWNKKKFY